MQLSPKAAYRNFCALEKNIPLFLNDWWMDAVCGDSWDVALVQNGDEVIGALPYLKARRFGFRLLNMPKLTSFLGPVFKYPEGQKYVSKLSYEMEIMEKLIEQIPSFDLFRQSFHYSIANWLPFYWKGYEQTTRYTYLLDLDNLNHVFVELKSSVRGKIRKAEGIVTVQHSRPLEDFYNVFCMTFERQKIKPPIDLVYLKKIDDALSKRNQRKIFYAVDKDGKVHSALYLIWDNHSSYVHMVGENPQLRNSGAGILLIWKAIEYTRNEIKLTTFDFLGSMIESVEPVRLSFGAKQVPYFQIKKVNSRIMKLFFSLSN
ncbi:MAG: GNAT family N-acetyltransferase [Bacteroidetes bacterium]|nr:GNAT family N-acetyltransferase [Bacteroidota bacterium]